MTKSASKLPIQALVPKPDVQLKMACLSYV
jgi:hypothetical protein